jgi:PAS domain S-box-containing protein
MSDPPASSPAVERDEARQLREMNEALLVSSARQHELAEVAQKAEERSRESEERLAAELAATQRLQAVREQLLSEMARRQTLFDSILSSVHDLVYVFDREGRFTYANRMLLELWGLSADQALGKTMAELKYPKDVEEQLLTDVRKVIATGQVVTSVTHYTNAAGVSGYYENILAPVPSADGRVELITGSSRDITERKQAEITQQLLLGELDHRVKNTLATVQAIAQQTLRRTSSPEQFVAGFSGRILALARVHTLLTNATWQGADLRELIRDQVLLGPIDETRLTAWGPSIKLEPQMALHMAMVLHELGTNSHKYGALSVANGWVTVSWTVQGQELRLQWLERGGPPVEKSARQGFGTLMIEQSVSANGGTAQMLRETQGVNWIITLSLKTAGTLAATQSKPMAATAPADQPATPPKNTTRAQLIGKRVLILEDEPLVAFDLSATLQDAGIEAVGPAGTTEEALRLIETVSLDAALVDANLQGRPVDEVAAALMRRNVPFAFVTGYSRSSLPEAHRGAAMIAKPYTPKALLDATEMLIAGGRC